MGLLCSSWREIPRNDSSFSFSLHHNQHHHYQDGQHLPRSACRPGWVISPFPIHLIVILPPPPPPPRRSGCLINHSPMITFVHICSSQAAFSLYIFLESVLSLCCCCALPCCSPRQSHWAGCGAMDMVGSTTTREPFKCRTSESNKLLCRCH